VIRAPVLIETRPKSETRQRLGARTNRTGALRSSHLPGLSESIAVHGFLWSARTLVLAITCRATWTQTAYLGQGTTFSKSCFGFVGVAPPPTGAWAQPLCCMLYVLDFDVSQACQTRYFGKCNCTVLVVIDHRPRVGRNRPTICNVWPGQPAMAPAMCRVTGRGCDLTC